MLSASEISKLESIGVFLSKARITCFKQGNNQEVLYELPISSLVAVELVKTSEREWNMKHFFWWLVGHTKYETIDRSTVYTLIFTHKNAEKKILYLSNFDLITIQKSVKKLHKQIQDENQD